MISTAAPVAPAATTPVAILTGFLGSGKTTLLNRLLAHPAMRETAVLVNEIGAIGIDQALVREVSDEIVLLGSGCICCTLRDGLVESLDDLRRRRTRGEVPAFARVIVETTGLADPAPIVHALLREPALVADYRFDGIVTTVDGLLGAGQLATHPEAARQAAMADRLVLTKTDIAPPKTVERVREHVTRLNPGAPLLRAAERLDLGPAHLFDVALPDPPAARGWLRAEAYAGAETDHLGRFSTFCLEFDRPVGWEAFSEWLGLLLASRGESLLRVKGIVAVAGEPRPIAIHGVQHVFHAPRPLTRWPWEDRRSRLVFVTFDLPRSAVERSLAAFLAEA